MKNTIKLGKPYCLFLLIIMLLSMLVPAALAQVAVKAVTFSTPMVFPGDEVQIQLTIENPDDEDVQGVLLALDLSQVPFAPVGSSTEKAIGEIEEHDRERVSFTIKAFPTADSGMYKIPVILTVGNSSKTSIISVEVQAQTRLEVLSGDADSLILNEKSTVNLKFVNTGQAQIKFLKATLQESPFYQILSPKTIYIGDVDIADFETEEFIIIPQAQVAALFLDLEYRDAQNRLLTSFQAVPLKVFFPEEAEQLGIVSQKSSFFPLAGAVILLTIGIIVFRRWKRRRKNAP